MCPGTVFQGVSIARIRPGIHGVAGHPAVKALLIPTAGCGGLALLHRVRGML